MDFPSGRRIKWRGMSRDLHGIVLKLIPKGQEKRISRAELKNLAVAGLIPKDGITVGRVFSEGKSKADQYLVLKFSIGPMYSVAMTIVTFHPGTPGVTESQFLLNTQWLVYMRRKRKLALIKSKARRGVR